MEQVAICVAQDAFCDFTSLDQIFELCPERGFLFELVLKEPGWLYFAKMSKEGLTTEILKVPWYATEF